MNNNRRFFRRDSHPFANAMIILADDSRAKPEFKAAFDATVKELSEMPLTVEKLRALGGWTELINKTFEKHCNGAMGEGSKLIPALPLHKYLVDMEDIRGRIFSGRRRTGANQ